MTKTLCIHAHFYQPPRDNPWLAAILPQPSAWPFPDWNARITSQCYAPCALSPSGPPPAPWINAYALLSFNIGPTLADWLRTFAPATWAQILAADAQSVQRLGHGNAIAQVYNHVILPLANERDKKTQIQWGIKHFMRDFGRAPAGMWLAETAADIPTLEALCDAKIAFTILSPTQADRVRPNPSQDWSPFQASAVQTYWHPLPSGRRIAVAFYDAALSSGISFGGLLRDGDALAAQILQSLRASADQAPLLLGASDGETYGHHWPRGDEALAAALRVVQEHGVEVTNLAAWLHKNPPSAEVQIHENTAWSCAHGLGRWTRDCGCRLRSDWHQRWRGPLRLALDQARDDMAQTFEQVGAALFHDPWEARNLYIDPLLAPEHAEAWLDSQLRPNTPDADRPKALALLEAQRFAMLMYTSCGWFFDEVSGIETIQCLQYAARAFELTEAAAGKPLGLEAQLLEALERVPSNLHPNARAPYEQLVRAHVSRAQKPPVSEHQVQQAEQTLHRLYDAEAAKLLRDMAARDEQTSPLLRALGEAVLNARFQSALAQNPPNAAQAASVLGEARESHLIIHEQPARHALGAAILAALSVDALQNPPLWLFDLLALTKTPPCEVDLRPLQRAVMWALQEDPTLRVDPALWTALGLPLA